MLGHVAVEPDSNNLDTMIDELARVLHEVDAARHLVLRAGFPAADLPRFDTPRAFWTRVSHAMVDGKTVGGIAALVEQVKLAFPGNRFFASYQAVPSSAAVSSKPMTMELGSSIDGGVDGIVSPHHWMPQGLRWSIQVWTYHYELRGDIARVLKSIGYFVSGFEDVRAMQHGEVCLMGVPEHQQGVVREHVEELSLRVEFEPWCGGLHHLVELYRERFTLALEEVDVLHAVLSGLGESDIVPLVGLPAKRVQRHIRRLCLSFQVATMAEIPPAAYAG